LTLCNLLTFIVPEKRDRYLELLDSERGRKKLVWGFHRCKDLDMRFASLIPLNQQTAESIERILKSKGASDKCYVMSSDYELDAQEMLLSEALQKTVGRGGTFISCIAGKSSYFEFDEPSKRYILEK